MRRIVCVQWNSIMMPTLKPIFIGRATNGYLPRPNGARMQELYSFSCLRWFPHKFLWLFYTSQSVQIGRHCGLLSSSPTLQYPSLSYVNLRKFTPRKSSIPQGLYSFLYNVIFYYHSNSHFHFILSLPGLFTLKFTSFSCFLIFLTSKLVK